jgi:hypothetical protein
MFEYISVCVKHEVITAVIVKNSISWDVTLYSPVKVTNVSEEHIVSIFRVEQ